MLLIIKNLTVGIPFEDDIARKADIGLNKEEPDQILESGNSLFPINEINK